MAMNFMATDIHALGLSVVVNDICGLTDLKIIHAICNGETNPETLASFRSMAMISLNYSYKTKEKHKVFYEATLIALKLYSKVIFGSILCLPSLWQYLRI